MIERLEVFHIAVSKNLDLTNILDMIPMSVLVSESELKSTVDKLVESKNSTNLIMISRVSDFMELYPYLKESTNLPDIKPGIVVVDEIPVFSKLDLLSSVVYTLALVKLLVI